MTTKQQLMALTQKQGFKMGVVSAVSFAAGTALSYVIVDRKLRLKYEAISEKEIKDAKLYYAKLNKSDEYADPEKLFADLVDKDRQKAEEIVEQNQYRTESSLKTVPGGHPALTPVIDDSSAKAKELIDEGKKLAEVLHEAAGETEAVAEEIESHNVFKDARSANSRFDYDEEVPRRSPDKPYVITTDEFTENEGDFQQLSLTYYEGDDVLADEQDQPIQDTETTVGNHNLTNFGYGSHDKNIVHVRNEKLELDFEIARSQGSFAQEVYGFVEHSDEPRVRRMRRSDDG